MAEKSGPAPDRRKPRSTAVPAQSTWASGPVRDRCLRCRSRARTSTAAVVTVGRRRASRLTCGYAVGARWLPVVTCGRAADRLRTEPRGPAGTRTTGRLRAALADAVVGNRCADEVARAHRVSWPTVARAVEARAHRVSWPTVARAVEARAAEVLGEPAPTPVLGIDETRFGRPRWVRGEDGAWSRSDPWETGFVDLAGSQGLLGQVEGRTSRSVSDWLAGRSEQFRAAITVVALDPSAPYAAAVRYALPHAAIAVDHFHLVALANQAVTRVRQRVTRDLLGHRGRAVDPVWANRRLLLRGRERLSEKAFTRMWNGCIDHDPSGDLLAAWIAKEELRALLACARRSGQRHDIS